MWPLCSRQSPDLGMCASSLGFSYRAQQVSLSENGLRVSWVTSHTCHWPCDNTRESGIIIMIAILYYVYIIPILYTGHWGRRDAVNEILELQNLEQGQIQAQVFWLQIWASDSPPQLVWEGLSPHIKQERWSLISVSSMVFRETGREGNKNYVTMKMDLIFFFFMHIIRMFLEP